MMNGGPLKASLALYGRVLALWVYLWKYVGLLYRLV